MNPTVAAQDEAFIEQAKALEERAAAYARGAVCGLLVVPTS